MRRKGKSGFTLIELLVVIIILGILAAVAIPRYLVARDRARGTEAIQQIGVISDEVNARLQIGGTEPADMAALGYTVVGGAWTPDPGNSLFNYTFTNATNIVTATKIAVPNISTTITFHVVDKTWGGNYPGALQGEQ